MPLAEVGEKNPARPVLVTDRTMNKALQEYPIFVLMGFADWCGYCQMMNATVPELSRELQGQVVFGLMDAEKNNQTAEIYNLFSYPRLLIFLNGSLISTQSEYKSSSELMRVLKENIPNLDKSRSGLALPLPSLSIRRQDVTMDMVGNISDIDGNDTTLKYLEMILDVAAVNRTTGNTINIFILNIDD
jgi:thioredoxin 1